ncbi:hypothetical protein BMI91_19670 [Thioclava sediminum]|uniref:NrS-1 polymerase-like helicase domain-containing protein n=1 Tax=Thioclava sediminum TaxID=1915319 RepID=A0ABX3MSH1_9RHOB|nr:primase-helicase family protein [Thioclava sediminum]OOY22503.1 hypothetical protein BMI91_19670 [Thioclava sediminum]
MTKKTKLPSVNRRPAGLTPKIEQAISNAAAGLTAADVEAYIDGQAVEAVCEWLEKRPSVKAEHLWWVLERNCNEDEMLAELGVEEEADPLLDTMSKLRDRYVYSTFRDEVWDRRANSWISTRAMDNAEAHAMPLDDKGRAFSAFDVFRRDAKAARVHNERYMPGVDRELPEADGVKWLNTWKAPSVKPAKGDASMMLDHMLYLCNGNKEQAGHLADWLAYTYQNPGKKITHAPLIISNYQGVGKDTLSIAMSRVIGESNAYWVQDEAVSEGRYHFMKAAQLVIIPEVMCGDRRDIANKFKPLITQPTVEINEKHVKPYTVQNTANFLMYSNQENAAYIEDNDRRYFVVICKQKPRSPSYYVDLYDYINGDDIASFAHFLATRDLSKFNPSAPAPDTEDKKVVQRATRGGVEAFLSDLWESTAAPFDGDVINLREALETIAEKRGAPKMTIQQISAFLKKVGGGDLSKRRIGRDGGSQIRVWAVRNFEDLENESLAVLDKCYIERKSLSAARFVVQNSATSKAS